MYQLPQKDLNEITKRLGKDIFALSGKNLFLTGATGFIGKCILESLLWMDEQFDLDIKIYAISRSPNSFYKANPHFLTKKQLFIFESDVRGDLSKLDIPPCHYVIHGATDVVLQSSPADVFTTCVDGTSKVLSYARTLGCKKFLLLSSGAVYGKHSDEAGGFPETYKGQIDLEAAGSAYALGKQVSEWLANQHKNSMDINIVRCFALVGPYLPLDKHFAIGNFIKDAIAGRDIQINGDGTPLRSYLYVSDLCWWLLKILLSNKSGTWNLGSNEALTISDLADVVRRVLNPNIKVNINGKNQGNFERYIPNISKANFDLGLTPTVSLVEAIQRTADWNLKNVN